MFRRCRSFLFVFSFFSKATRGLSQKDRARCEAIFQGVPVITKNSLNREFVGLKQYADWSAVLSCWNREKGRRSRDLFDSSECCSDD